MKLPFALALLLAATLGATARNPAPAGSHTFALRVPTLLAIERKPTVLSVSVDHEKSLAEVQVSVHAAMTTGVSAEYYIYPEGTKRPAQPLRQGIASGTDFNLGGSIFNTTQDGFPVAGVKYVVEARVVVFETGVPPGHLWSPTSKGYRVLHETTLKQIVPG